MHESFLNHVSEDLLEGYVLGKIAEPDQDMIEDHLLVCPGCRRRLFDIERFVSAIQRAAASLAEAHGDPETRFYRHTITRFWPAVPAGHESQG